MTTGRAPLLFSAFLALAAASCDEGTGPTHVACIGDSITVGDGASSPQQTYPAALHGMLGPKVDVQMYGHSGATVMTKGAGDLPYDEQPEYAAATTYVSQAGPNARVAVVVLLGTNDSKATVWDGPGRKERFEADFNKLIDHFAGLATHPTVYVATPLGTGKNPCCGIRGDVLLRDVAPLEEEIAKKRGLTVIDLTQFAATHPELLPDGVHPSDKGYEELASKVSETLTQSPPAPQPNRGFFSRLH